MVQFIGVQILMENSASKEFKHIKPHFDYIKETYGVKLPFYRYKIIRSSFEPTQEEIEKLCQLLGETSIK